MRTHGGNHEEQEELLPGPHSERKLTRMPVQMVGVSLWGFVRHASTRDSGTEREGLLSGSHS